MNPKNIITKALKHHLLYIQMGNHYDQEARLQHTNKCLSYIENDGIVDENWLIDQNLFFLDVFNEYSKYLKDEIQNAIPDENEISRLRKERTTVNLLLKALKQHFGVE